MSEKPAFKGPKNYVGYISKTKTGKSMITVDQDFVLKKGDKLFISKPQDTVDSLVANGILTEEQGEQRKAKIPDWKLSEVTKAEFKD
jgi:hypothetical protein